MVCADPIFITAPEYSVGHSLELAAAEGRDPFDKVSSVVRRLAFERGCDDDDGSVLGEVVDGGVESSDGSVEAVTGSLGRDPLSEGLRVTDVRSVQHV